MNKVYLIYSNGQTDYWSLPLNRDILEEIREIEEELQVNVIDITLL